MSATPEQFTKLATRFKEPLAEADARLFEQLQATYVSLTGDAELPRHWPELSPDAIPDAIDFLNLATSVKNTAPCKYVDNPMANNEVYEGRWRQAFIRRVMQGEVTKLVQVLRKGYAESINWDEARLADGDNQPLQPARALRIQFVNLDFSKLGAMIGGIETTKYFTNPVIAGEVYDGPLAGDPPAATDQRWRVLSAKPGRSDDGSGVITLTLSKNLVMSPDALPAPILLSDEKALLSPFAHDTTSASTKYVWEYRWIDPGYAQTLRAGILLTAGVIDAKAIKVEDGSFSIQVLTESRAWAGTLDQIWSRNTQNPSFAAERITDTYSHIPFSNLLLYRTALETPTAGYKVSVLVDDTKEPGFVEFTQTQDKLFPGTVTADNGAPVLNEYSELLKGRVQQTTVWIGVPDALLTAAMDTLGTPPAGCFLKSLKNDYNGTGSCTITRVLMEQGSVEELVDADARLVGGDNNALIPERTIQRIFVNLKLSKLGAMMDAIENTTYSDSLIVEGETYEGRWRIISSKPGRTEEGSGTITQTLAKNLVITPDALPSPVLLSDEKALLSPFAHDTASASVKYVWEYRWIDPDYAQALRNAIALTAGVVDAKALKVEDGTCNIQVLTETRTWTGSLAQVWEHRDNNPTFLANQVVDTFSHIPLTSLAAFKTTLSAATSGYKVSSLIDETAGEGFGRIVRTQDRLFDSGTIPIPDTRTDEQKLAARTPRADNGTLTQAEYLPLLTNGVFRTTAWIGVPDASLAVAMDTLAAPPTGYFVRTLVNNYNGTGSCTIVRTIGPAGPYERTPQAVQFPGEDDERRTYWHAGYTAAQAAAMYPLLQSDPAYIDAGYKVDSVELREYRWETVLLIQNISKLNLALTPLSAASSSDYTSTFGLVTRATTIYPNIESTSVDALKASILADTTKLILSLKDDDVGQGKANVVCTWRSKPAAPTALGAIRSSKPSKFHQTTQERVWVNVNITDANSLKDAVALALAGTGIYAKDGSSDTITGATGEDAGDKTGIVRQNVVKKPASYDYADYSLLESFNPHGLQSARMIISVREYPEVCYADLATPSTGINALLFAFLGTPPKGRIQASLNGNGTFAMRALKEGTPDWGNTAPSFVQVGIKNKGVIGQQTTLRATGVPIATAEAKANAVAATTGNNLDDVRVVERDNGEAVIEAMQTAKSETAVIVRDIPAEGLQRGTQERIWPLVLNGGNLTTIWAACLTEGITGTTGVLEYRQADLLGNGMWRVSSLVTLTPEVTIGPYTSDYNDDSTGTITQVQDAAAIPTIANGKLSVDVAGLTQRLVSLQFNRYGKYDYVLHKSTARTSIKSIGTVASPTWTLYGEYYFLPYGWSNGEVVTVRRWRVGYAHTLSFHATCTLAAAALDGADERSGQPQKIADGLWMAHRIVRADAVQGGPIAV
jgi:hypothetical protein